MAALSQTPFFYSFKGLALMVHKLPRFKSFLWSATRYAVIATIITALLFAFAWPRQYALLKTLFGDTWWVWEFTTGLTLWEALIPVYWILHLGMGDIQNRLFDDVLHEVGVTKVEPLAPPDRSELRQLGEAAKRARASRSRGMLGRAATPLTAAWVVMTGRPGESWWASWLRLTVLSPLLVFWPLGPFLYAWLNGYAMGSSLHSHYMQLKGVEDRDEQHIAAASRRRQYSAFGTVAMLLTLVPVAGWGLGLSNAAGAALWAGEMEARKQPIFLSAKSGSLLRAQSAGGYSGGMEMEEV